MVDKTKRNLIRCRCKYCPSYSLECLMKATPGLTKVLIMPHGPSKEAHVESLFCAYEKSSCIKERKGCKCPVCPVHKEYDLDKVYYCLGDM